MMRPITWKALLAVLAAGVLVTMPQGVLTQSSAEVELRRAIETEQAKGDRKSAIQQYEKLAAGKDRAVGARALLEMARLYGAIGNADARKVYERIIKDFPEQAASVSEARARLTSLESQPASVSRVRADLYTAGIDLRSGRLTSSPKLVPNQPSGSNIDPAWSPDGKWLAYVTEGQADSQFGTLSILSWESGQRREIRDYTQLARLLWPSWSPDGRVIYAQGIDQKGNDGIYRVDVTTGAIEPVAIGKAGTHSSFPMVTSDGRRLIYFVQIGTSPGVMLERDLSSNAERQLLDGVVPNTTGMPVLSPDGRYLHYVALDNGTGESTLSVLPLAGGPSRELVRAKQPQILGTGWWTPDSQSILYTRSESPNKREKWMMPLSGGTPRRVEIPDESRMMRIHPDGKTVIFSTSAVR